MENNIRVRGEDGSNRVIRGGSWINNQWNCRTAYRNANHPANRFNNHGFRLASSLLRQTSHRLRMMDPCKNNDQPLILRRERRPKITRAGCP
jgi:hypothetical protein